MTALFSMESVAGCSCAAVDEWLSEGRGEICEIHLSPLRPQWTCWWFAHLLFPHIYPHVLSLKISPMGILNWLLTSKFPALPLGDITERRESLSMSPIASEPLEMILLNFKWRISWRLFTLFRVHSLELNYISSKWFRFCPVRYRWRLAPFRFDLSGKEQTSTFPP